MQSTWQTGTNWTQTLPAGTWYWRVTARDIVHTTLGIYLGNQAASRIVDRTPAAPTLMHQPDSTSSGDNVSTTLQWNPVSCADGDPSEYYVEIDTAATFDSGNSAELRVDFRDWLDSTGRTDTGRDHHYLVLAGDGTGQYSCRCGFGAVGI